VQNSGRKNNFNIFYDSNHRHHPRRGTYRTRLGMLDQSGPYYGMESRLRWLALPAATNNLEIGGTFCYTMAANDDSAKFDFEGTYTDVVENERIEYSLADDRHISVTFEEEGDTIRVTEIFDAETENPIEMQRAGWQAILDNFRDYTEASI